MSLLIIVTIFEPICKNAQGCDGHGHAFESKERLYSKTTVPLKYTKGGVESNLSLKNELEYDLDFF